MYMNFLFIFFVFVLFFILTPGILVTLPKKGSKMVVALVHGVIFATTLAVSKYFFWKSEKRIFEGATGGTTDYNTDPVYKGLGELKNKINNLKKNEKNFNSEKKSLLSNVDTIMNNQKKSTKPKLTPNEITTIRNTAWQTQCQKTPQTIEEKLRNEPTKCKNPIPDEFMPNGV